MPVRQETVRSERVEPGVSGMEVEPVVSIECRRMRAIGYRRGTCPGGAVRLCRHGLYHQRRTRAAPEFRPVNVEDIEGDVRTEEE
jgi:hypothetical protein